MKWVLIGHRGVGKSGLLQRLQSYFSETIDASAFFDLDQAIEEKHDISIAEIFAEQGEIAFRQMETTVFDEIYAKHKIFIVALGAGFPLDHLPSDVTRVWVNRKTDAMGRIFLDRPRLDVAIDPLAEYIERFPQRQEAYRRQADIVYTLPEGCEKENRIEKDFFVAPIKGASGVLTLYPRHLRAPRTLQFCETIELRDDIWRGEEIEDIIRKFPYKKFLFSLRQGRDDVKAALRLLDPRKISYQIDWALELGEPPQDFPVQILSAHVRGENESLADFLKRVESVPGKGLSYKIAPLIASLRELKLIYDWQKKAPATRSVLPRSIDGRWSWFRCYMKDRQPLNFWQDGDGSAIDQPVWWEWFSNPHRVGSFAAVLGEPVLHSWSPWTHFEFFSRRQMPFYFIHLDESDFFTGIDYLRELGLLAAAVTSPLKKVAAELCEIADQSINTLYYKNKWLGTNTDFQGLSKAAEAYRGMKVRVWGGGGTLQPLKLVFPDAEFYSVRTARSRSGDSSSGGAFDVLVWAAGPRANTPPREWRAQRIFDLNYREDSEARRLAFEWRVPYTNGKEMFLEQAMGQQIFWKSL